jgi:hypothetical protein
MENGALGDVESSSASRDDVADVAAKEAAVAETEAISRDAVGVQPVTVSKQPPVLPSAADEELETRSSQETPADGQCKYLNWVGHMTCCLAHLLKFEYDLRC